MPIQRFSKLFWFTVLAGTLASALFSAALVSFLSMRLNGMLAFCTLATAKDCPSSDTFDRWLHAFIAAELAGTFLLFWTASKIGRKRFSPALTSSAIP